MWYCPEHPPPAEQPSVAMVALREVEPVAPNSPPTEPFALLRWERDRDARRDAEEAAKAPRFHLIGALLGRKSEE